jgi:O-antigen ligase
MQSQNFWFFKVLVFLVIFICLPLPHGNIYPFVALMLSCIYSAKKYRIDYEMVEIGLLAFFTWSLLSALWAVDLSLTCKIYGKVILIMLGGWLWVSNYNHINQETRRTLQNLVLLSGLLLLGGLFILVIDLKFNGRLYQIIDQSISPALIHACIACSLAIWLNLAKLSKWLQVCILLLAIWTLQNASSDAAALGVLIGAGVLVMHKFLPRFLRAMFIYGMPIVWGTIPFIFRMLTHENYHQWASSLDPSYTHRLFIWHSATTRIFERFWTGFGFGSSRFCDLGLKGDDISVAAGNAQQILLAPEACVHPHNFMLQIWLELGAIGVILGSLTWIIYWRRQYHKSDSYYIAFWASALCVAATSISIWQSWWLFLLVTLVPIYSEKNNSNFNRY